MVTPTDFDRVRIDQSREDNRDQIESFADKGLPENQTYIDTGCELAPSCLKCPMAMCKYDEPNRRRRRRNVMRDQEIVRLRSKGLRVTEIAKICKTSDRTVYRVIRSDAASKRPISKPASLRRPSRIRNVHSIPMAQLAVWQQYSMPEMSGIKAA